MTNSEKIDKIYDIVCEIEPMVKAHNKTLYGNGQPGIVSDIIAIKTEHIECAARRLREDPRRANTLSLAAIAVMLITNLITLLLT